MSVKPTETFVPFEPWSIPKIEPTRTDRTPTKTQPEVSVAPPWVTPYGVESHNQDNPESLWLDNPNPTYFDSSTGPLYKSGQVKLVKPNMVSGKSPKIKLSSLVNKSRVVKTKASSSRAGGSRTNPRPLRSARFGPPSAVTLAPASIGNTISGVVSQTLQTRTGVCVSGRDFCFQPIGSGTVQTWTLIGGAPLAPAVFVDSTLRQYQQIYNRFRFLSFTAHYITSSPTSSNGDVMFYYGKNRDSVFLNQTSGNLLPFVISDPNTKIGPQWQNMSASFSVSGNWKSTDYGMESDISNYCDGELFLLSKTSTTDSPGYVMFDYIVEFSELSTIPRLLALPVSKGLWFQLGLNINQAAVVDVVWGASIGGSGNISGSLSAVPPNSNAGDIFKVIIDRTNSTFGANSAAITNSLIESTSLQTSTPIVMSDGMTLYGVYASGNQIWTFYPSAAAAYSGNRPLSASATLVVAGSTLQVWVSYVGTVGAAGITPNF